MPNTAMKSSDFQFECIRGLEVCLVGEKRWQASIRKRDSQLLEKLGIFPTKEAAIEAAIRGAKEHGERAQQAFKEWMISARAQLSAD